MQTSSLLRAAFGAAFVLLALPAMAEIYRAEGMASLEVGRVAARQAAIEDALRQIAITHQGALQGSSEVNNGAVTAESLMVGPVSLPGKTRVISETQRAGMLIVTVEHDTDPPGNTAAPAPNEGGVAAASCQRAALPPGRFLARRLLASYFPLQQPMQAGDLGSMASWFPAELVRRLNQQRDVQALDAGNMSLFPDGKVQEPMQAADTVRDIGNREGVQFVLAGRILDTSVTRREPRPILFDHTNEAEQGMYYTGPMSGLLGFSIKQVPVERRLVVEYWLYDALSGGVLLREQVTREARGNVAVDSMHLFDTGTLAKSDYGRLLDQTLTAIAGKLHDTMQCLPFSSRVVRVEGDRIYLSAGALDGLAVRDRLLLYKPRPNSEVKRLDGSVLGVPEQVVGDLEVEQVQPRLAMARLRSSSQKVQVGDWVRFPLRPN
ncbi:flagella assembly protein FlgT middle domain-containing protein [Vogesella sp. LIG4]|uniref:flagella assembly protein FlgT middle domain-containing protein n=1 Tax=Vogesella sp. LIG4 TaxID=1192162 RepID=UPI00081F978C|nr:flagella assembly protein FlgT middle domain-containing protein [Vogesella sp. LIG4]SCK20917.1 Flagellar assembly protein T, middle domain [Vogesella sp. LIG4]